MEIKNIWCIPDTLLVSRLYKVSHNSKKKKKKDINAISKNKGVWLVIHKNGIQMFKKYVETPLVPREVQLKAVMWYHIQAIIDEILKNSQHWCLWDSGVIVTCMHFIKVFEEISDIFI